MTAPSSIYRERFALTLAHRPVDRCPIDFGGTPQSTIDDPGLREGLARALGFEGPAPADYDKFDRRILEQFDIDFRRAGALIGFKTPRNRFVSDTESVDEYGICHRCTAGRWSMVEFPLAQASLDDLAAYEFPRLDQIISKLDVLAQQAEFLFRHSPYVVVGEHPVYGVLELACWLCGYDQVMLKLALEPEFISLLFSKILEFQKGLIREYYSRLGPFLHLTTSGDDFGTQHGLFMSPAMWREFVKPCMRERIAFTAQFTDAVYMHHSCGAIAPIIADLAEIDVRILNPIQPQAAGMDPAVLKKTFGDKITFHGGLDTQEVLPSNDPIRIEKAVADLLTIINSRETGGFIFAPAHNFQRDVTPAAVICMYRAALRFFEWSVPKPKKKVRPAFGR